MTDERIDLIPRLGPDSAFEVIANLGAGNCGSPVSIQIRTLACARLINVELFAPHLPELESLEFAAAVVENRQMDVLLWARARADKSLDIALLLDLLEHFERPQALDVLEELRRVVRERIVIWLPFGPCEQEPLGGNPLQIHRSTWRPEDFSGDNVEVEFFSAFHSSHDPPADAGWVIEYLNRQALLA